MPRTTQAKTWEKRVRALSAIAGAMVVVVRWCVCVPRFLVRIPCPGLNVARRCFENRTFKASLELIAGCSKWVKRKWPTAQIQEATVRREEPVSWASMCPIQNLSITMTAALVMAVTN